MTHYRTWEFNPEKPIRDITLPYLLLMPAFGVLHQLMPMLDELGVVKSSLLVTLPRILFACANVINFILVKKLCLEINYDHKLALWLFSTSYVTWVYLTRSFSNTTETFLVSSVCLILVGMHQNLNKCRDSNKGQKEALKSHTKHCACLGVLICLGIFNRPTFLVFLLVPLMWFTCNTLKTVCRFHAVWIGLMFVSGATFLLTFFVLCMVNSAYYNPDFFHTTSDLAIQLLSSPVSSLPDIILSFLHSLKVPPHNFIMYNVNSSNLAQHGVHPRATHFLVNLPLLLGPLAFDLYWNFTHLLIRRGKGREGWIIFAVIVPVACLSCFTHQEPRFLLPVLPFAVVSAVGSKLVQTKSWQCFTLVFNVLAFLFFGFLHQAGLIPALSSLQQELTSESKTLKHMPSAYHLVFYCTYMPPRYILLANSQTIDLTVHDLGGRPAEELELKVKQINTFCENSLQHCHIKLFFPGSVEKDVKNLVNWQNMNNFCPHLSTERLPKVGEYLNGNISLAEFMSQLCLKVYSWSSREKES